MVMVRRPASTTRACTATGCPPRTDRSPCTCALTGPDSSPRRHLELNQIFAEEGLDLAFWFTFAGYHQPASTDPRRDVDLASYGLVSMLPEGPARGYQDLGWRPRLAFEAMAKLKAG